MALDHGVELLLEWRAETNQWKVLFGLFGHITGYFLLMADRGSPPERTAGGEPYLEPRRGCFYSHDPSIGELYDGSKDWGIALQLALYADAIGEDNRAAVWGARALDLARGSGHQSIVERLAPCFIPQLILGDQYAEAIAAALDHGAIHAARALEPDTARTNWLQPVADLDAILGDRPNANWQRAEELSAMTGVLPAAVRICSIALDRPESARSAAGELISICRQIGAGASDPGLWSDIAELFEMGFVEPVPGGELKGIVDRLPAIGATRKLLALLFASMRPDITAENALIMHLSILPCLSQIFDRPFAAYRLILVPFITDYWNAVFRSMRFRFCHPQLVQSALAEASASSADRRIHAVIRAILLGIPLRPPPEIKDWLDSIDTQS